MKRISSLLALATVFTIVPGASACSTDPIPWVRGTITEVHYQPEAFDGSDSSWTANLRLSDGAIVSITTNTDLDRVSRLVVPENCVEVRNPGYFDGVDDIRVISPGPCPPPGPPT